MWIDLTLESGDNAQAVAENLYKRLQRLIVTIPYPLTYEQTMADMLPRMADTTQWRNLSSLMSRSDHTEFYIATSPAEIAREDIFWVEGQPAVKGPPYGFPITPGHPHYQVIDEWYRRAVALEDKLFECRKMISRFATQMPDKRTTRDRRAAHRYFTEFWPSLVPYIGANNLEEPRLGHLRGYKTKGAVVSNHAPARLTEELLAMSALLSDVMEVNAWLGPRHSLQEYKK